MAAATGALFLGGLIGGTLVDRSVGQLGIDPYNRNATVVSLAVQVTAPFIATDMIKNLLPVLVATEGMGGASFMMGALMGQPGLYARLQLLFDDLVQ